jgi:hypothetical protein
MKPLPFMVLQETGWKIPLWQRGMKGDFVNKRFAIIDFLIGKFLRKSNQYWKRYGNIYD